MLPNYDNIAEYMMFLGVVGDINKGVTSIAYNSKDIEDCRKAFIASLDQNKQKLQQ